MARQKKNKHTGAKVTAATAVLLAALAGGSFGISRGGFHFTGSQYAGTNGTVMQPSETVEKTSAQDESILTITVQNSEILYRGDAVALSQLEALLLSDYTEDKQIILQDDHAIKATFDEVSALLAKLSLPYTSE